MHVMWLDMCLHALVSLNWFCFRFIGTWTQTPMCMCSFLSSSACVHVHVAYRSAQHEHGRSCVCNVKVALEEGKVSNATACIHLCTQLVATFDEVELIPCKDTR